MTALVKACVIGWPIEHSRSPLIHGYWLRRYGIDGSYEKIAAPPESLGHEIRRLIDDGFAGANVTLPHKEAVLELADEIDDSARTIGAANTLWFEDGRVCAANTDAYGFITHLDLSAPQWDAVDRPVVVLGAGGAARAVLAGLIGRGVSQIRLLNRTRARAEALAEPYEKAVSVCEWDRRAGALEGGGLLVNTTSLGMTGAPALEIDLSALPDDAVVADIVYVPLETDLLGRARGRGLATVDGLGMLLHQAVPGFERWFGVRPEVNEALRALLVADLAA